ncbi:MAG: methyltransferase domain-containing protein [Deltaproteobacteria bacterium]|nr:methyltransferase domain-containing protein [Deltaproteobacteria bacterium]
MEHKPASEPAGEYAEKGDYHRALDPSWRYYPVYVEKMALVRRLLGELPPGTRIADLGCGEGLLVEEYRAKGYDIVGVDAAYRSEHVVRAEITDLPFPSASYDRALCLDVLEHLDLAAQPRAIAEMARILRPDGRALVSLPNLAHLASRLAFLLTGKLVRTSTVDRHPGDRPIGEFVGLLDEAGFRVLRRWGLFPTYPVVSALTFVAPAAALPLHRLHNRLHPPASWCFLNVLELEKRR